MFLIFLVGLESKYKLGTNVSYYYKSQSFKDFSDIYYALMWYKLENSDRLKRLKDDPETGNVEKQPYKINMCINKNKLNKVHD